MEDATLQFGQKSEDVYHPYDLGTGQSQTSEEISEKLENHFTTIHSGAVETELSKNYMKRLNKAHRVFKGMINTVLFFWVMVKQQIGVAWLNPNWKKSKLSLCIVPSYFSVQAPVWKDVMVTF